MIKKKITWKMYQLSKWIERMNTRLRNWQERKVKNEKNNITISKKL